MVKFKTEVRFPEKKAIPKDSADKIIMVLILVIKIVLNTFMPFFFGFYYGFTEKPLFLILFVILIFFNIEIAYDKKRKLRIKIIRTL